MNDEAQRSHRWNFDLNGPHSGSQDGDLNSTRSEVRLEPISKRRNHTSWSEAWRAENERERARLLACNEISSVGPLTLFAVNIARGFPNITAGAFRCFGWTSLKRRSSRNVWQKRIGVPDEKGSHGHKRTIECSG
jgi:hypothetical protein